MDSQSVANRQESPTLAIFGALSIADVDCGSMVISCGQCRANTRIHSTT